VNGAIGFLEVTGLTPTIAAIDAMEKTAAVKVLQCELNDFYGVCVKIIGPVAAVHAAMDVGKAVAEQMGGQPVARVIDRADEEAQRAIVSPAEYNALIEQGVVLVPANDRPQASLTNEEPVMSQQNYALGLIETQGFTAVFEAIDTACKTAAVEVVGKEKLGGGYVTVVIRGELSAVKAAVAAGQEKVEGLGKLIAAHVIARPSQSVVALLPKI
jgi:carbon dioxide concentrating mechanism protein CcmO